MGLKIVKVVFELDIVPDYSYEYMYVRDLDSSEVFKLEKWMTYITSQPNMKEIQSVIDRISRILYLDHDSDTTS